MCLPKCDLSKYHTNGQVKVEEDNINIQANAKNHSTLGELEVGEVVFSREEDTEGTN